MMKTKKFWALLIALSALSLFACGYIAYDKLNLSRTEGPLPKTVPVPLPAAAEPEPVKPPLPIQAQLQVSSVTLPMVKETLKTPVVEKIKAIKVPFEYKSSVAKKVMLTGSFNHWKEIKMTRKGDIWRAEEYILPNNNYYMFHYIVDGKPTPSPGRPKNDAGESLIKVEEPDKKTQAENRH